MQVVRALYMVKIQNNEEFSEDLIALDVPYFASFGSFVFWLIIGYMSIVSLLMWQIKHAVKTRQNLQNLDFSVKSRQILGTNSAKVDNWSIDEANMSSWSPANRFLMVFLPRFVWVIELLVFLLPTFKVHKLWEPQFDAYTSPSRWLENASSVQFRAAP